MDFRYTKRLALAGIEPSVGSRGDSYDNALAESIIGLYITELVHPRGPWSRLEELELATLEWVTEFFSNLLGGLPQQRGLDVSHRGIHLLPEFLHVEVRSDLSPPLGPIRRLKKLAYDRG